MWHRVLPRLFVFHSSLMDSLGRYFGEHGRGDVVRVEKDPSRLNGYYKVAKVEDLGSFQFCVVKCFCWVWWALIETRAICNGYREKLFHCEEKPALEQVPSKALPSPSLETQLNKVLRDIACPYSWPWMEQEDGVETLWVPPNLNYHVVLWVYELLLWGNILEASPLEGFT